MNEKTNQQKMYRVANSASDVREKINSVNKYSLVGVSGLGFPGKISTVRSLMFAKHASQRVCLIRPEVAHISTSAEDAYGQESSSFIKAESDLKLMKTFIKFPESVYSHVLYIFRDMVTGKYKCLLQTAVVWNTEKFGYEMNDYVGTKYKDGDIIPKGTVLSASTSFDQNNHYRAGVDARILYTPLHVLTEDSIWISTDLQDKLAYSLVDTPTVDIKEGQFLLNNYGDIDHYKAFPDIGEPIKDGILCSLREKSSVSTKREAMIPHINDINYYTEGIVTDIEIMSNDPDVEDSQLRYYLNLQNKWYSDIYTYISSIKNDMDENDSVLLDIYHKSEKNQMPESTKWSTKEKLPYIQINFTLLQHKDVVEGQKITGRHGNKSVVCNIVPTHLMPHTDDGRPIDMLANAFCPTNRIIAFGLYEPAITFRMERMHQYIVNEKIPPQEAVQMVADFMRLFNGEWADEIERKYRIDPERSYDDIVKNGLYLILPPFQEENVRDAIIEADKRWGYMFKRYTIMTKLRHRWITQKEQHAVGYQNTWVLKQEASKNLSAVSTGRTTLYDLPVKTSNYKHRLKKYSDNAIKFGEYDTYGFLQVVDADVFSKLSTYYRGSQYEANSILTSHLNDMGVPEGSINQFPQLECLKAYLKSMGMKFEHDFTVHSITSVDNEETFNIGNHEIEISGSLLRTVMIIYSYYLNYTEYLTMNNSNLSIGFDMVDFVNKIINETDLFRNKPQWYIDEAFPKFFELLPILNEEKYLK